MGSLTMSGIGSDSPSPDTWIKRKKTRVVKISIRETRLSPVSILNLSLCLFVLEGTYIIIHPAICQEILHALYLLSQPGSCTISKACSGSSRPSLQDVLF